MNAEFQAAFHDAQIGQGQALANMLLFPSHKTKDEFRAKSSALVEMAKCLTQEDLREMHKTETKPIT